MKEPIKAGDTCEVIGGLGRSKSPNLGLRVKVTALRGEHSQHGRMWACVHPDIQQLHDSGSYMKTGIADFAQDWLKKVDPDAPPPVAKTVEEGLSA